MGWFLIRPRIILPLERCDKVERQKDRREFRSNGLPGSDDS
jgi:hypothetical protein